MQESKVMDEGFLSRLQVINDPEVQEAYVSF